MRVATIYIPVSGGRADLMIAPGSGIVGIDSPESEYLIVYYEGSVLGAANMVHFEDRIRNAAGRLFTRYPTTALHGYLRSEVPSNFVAVGSINEAYQITFSDREKAIAYGYGEETFARREKAGLPRLAALTE